MELKTPRHLGQPSGPETSSGFPAAPGPGAPVVFAPGSPSTALSRTRGGRGWVLPGVLGPPPPQSSPMGVRCRRIGQKKASMGGILGHLS